MKRFSIALQIVSISLLTAILIRMPGKSETATPTIEPKAFEGKQPLNPDLTNTDLTSIQGLTPSTGIDPTTEEYYHNRHLPKPFQWILSGGHWSYIDTDSKPTDSTFIYREGWRVAKTIDSCDFYRDFYLSNGRITPTK